MLEILVKIESQLRELNKKVDLLINVQKSNLGNPLMQEYEELIEADVPLDVVALLSLPDHLRKTAMAMFELRKATAVMISEKTGRKRATESDCLNQLVRMGYLKKKREGLQVFFFIGEKEM